MNGFDPAENFGPGEQLTPSHGIIFERKRYFVPALTPLEDEEKWGGNMPTAELPGSENGGYRRGGERYEVSGTDEDEYFNAISSEMVSAPGMHAPALDIDHHCRLFPSSTPGHWHLYVDVAMPWWKYRLVLRVLTFVGILEPGYYKVAKERRATFLRRPTYYKKEMFDASKVDELIALRDRLRRGRHGGTGPTGDRRPAPREPGHGPADPAEPF